MGLFFSVLVFFGYIFGFSFVSLSLACGLYYMAELVEEYTIMTKRVIKYTTYTIATFHILLLFDGLSFYRVSFSLGCLGWYCMLLPKFPAIELSSPVFLSSCLLVIVNHFTWFFYFTDRLFLY